ncbi:hypothetical protein [Roseimarinus sediminis]|uniref:hypothetical protein n=1 Tax=Roseimarinus sediminis TaxID=1610899 RepID=UPI003D201B29
MFRTRKKLLFIAAIVLTLTTKAQEFEYGIRYDGIADNREFFSPYSQAESILGSRIAITAGTSVDSIHRLRAGLSYFYEYGSELFEQKMQPLLYYSVEKGPWGYKMGAFPRKGNIDYPYAIISEKVEYFHPTIDGLMVSYDQKNMAVDVFADWVSRQDSTRREQFMAGFTAKSSWKNFLLEEYWYMFHNAGRTVRVPGENMEDYMGSAVLLGYDFSELLPIDVLTLKTGLLTSAYRNRGNGLEFEINSSWYSELVADYRGFGVEAFAKIGSEHKFSHGDLFINNTRNYVRTRFYFTPINFERIKGQFMWSLHFANGDMDNQQQFRLVYLINEL